MEATPICISRYGHTLDYHSATERNEPHSVKEADHKGPGMAGFHLPEMFKCVSSRLTAAQDRGSLKEDGRSMRNGYQWVQIPLLECSKTGHADDCKSL